MYSRGEVPVAGGRVRDQSSELQKEAGASGIVLY